MLKRHDSLHGLTCDLLFAVVVALEVLPLVVDSVEQIGPALSAAWSAPIELLEDGGFVAFDLVPQLGRSVCVVFGVSWHASFL